MLFVGCAGAGKMAGDLSSNVKTVPFHYTRSATGNGIVPAELIKKDATGTATGTGTGTVTSLNDTSEVVCTFALNGAATTGGIEPHATVQTGACTGAGADNCIQCVASGSGTNACSIACNGTVHSNTNSAAQVLNLTLTYTSTIDTNMTELGIVRFDGLTTGWPELDFTAQGPSSPIPTASSIATVFAGCDGGTELDLVTTNALVNVDGISSARAEDNFQQIGRIVAVGSAACVAVHDFSIAAPLTGAETPNTGITTPAGSMTFTAKICDSITACAAP